MNSGLSSKKTSSCKWPIHLFHIYHNALVQMPKFCIIIVFDFSWDDCNSQEKLDNNGYAKFGGVNKVHYGLCKNGEYS